jgi:cell division protein ZapA (FtsZ GTPase activity inhibitor)
MVSQNEEKIVVAIAKQLNQQVDEMQSRYGSRLNKQDLLAMLLLTRSKELQDVKSQFMQLHALDQQLQQLEDILDESLANQQDFYS